MFTMQVMLVKVCCPLNNFPCIRKNWQMSCNFVKPQPSKHSHAVSFSRCKREQLNWAVPGTAAVSSFHIAVRLWTSSIKQKFAPAGKMIHTLCLVVPKKSSKLLRIAKWESMVWIIFPRHYPVNLGLALCTMRVLEICATNSRRMQLVHSPILVDRGECKSPGLQLSDQQKLEPGKERANHQLTEAVFSWSLQAHPIWSISLGFKETNCQPSVNKLCEPNQKTFVNCKC